MADDDDDKTEEPTDRKLKKAREEGNVPKSEDFNGFIGLSIGILVIFVLSMLYTNKLRSTMGGCLESIFITQIQDHMTNKCQGYLMVMVEIGCMILASGVFAAFLGYFILNKGFVIPKEPLKINVQAFDIAANLKNLLNKESFFGLIMSVIKEVFFYGSFLLLILYFLPAFVFQTFCFENCAGNVPIIFIYLLLGAYLLIAFVFTAIDVPMKIMFWKNKLKMSHKDLKDEHKETEGAPEIKRAQHEFRNQILQGAPMGAKNATFFIKGHNVIFGIRYNRAESPAPIIVIAGKTSEKVTIIEQIARQMRRLIIEDDDFSRKLANMGVVGRPVPLEFVKDIRKCVMELRKYEQEYGPVHPEK